MEQEQQTKNDAPNSLLGTLGGKRAGIEYYRNVRMAIHMNKEIGILTASN
jgi:hypothetical protein